MWYTDAFGWPITALPQSSTSTLERVEVSEVVNRMVQRACDFEPVKRLTTMPTTTATATAKTTTASTLPVKSRFKDVVEEVKEVLTESYPDLVSFCFFNFIEVS